MPPFNHDNKADGVYVDLSAIAVIYGDCVVCMAMGGGDAAHSIHQSLSFPAYSAGTFARALPTLAKARH